MSDDQYTILKITGQQGPSWTCDDKAEALALADEHGFTIEDIIINEAGGYYLVVQPELTVSVSTEWGGFSSQRDLVAAMIYNARANSPLMMTPERWERIKVKFKASARICLEQADEELQDL